MITGMITLKWHDIQEKSAPNNYIVKVSLNYAVCIIPVQFFPSPENPLLHWHVYELLVALKL